MGRKPKSNEGVPESEVKSGDEQPKTLSAHEILDLEAYFATKELRDEQIKHLDTQKALVEKEHQLAELTFRQSMIEIGVKRNKLLGAQETDLNRLEIINAGIRERLGLQPGCKFGYNPSTFAIVLED